METKVTTEVKETQIKTEMLERLGLKNAAKRLDSAAKMKAAYQKYLFIKPEVIDSFNKKLREDTLKEDKNAYHYKKLGFTKLEDYTEVPPVDVLEALERAQKAGCFDYYEVCKIDWIKEVKDPIVFGRINNCTDRFFIAQWDDDVSIQDLLKA